MHFGSNIWFLPLFILQIFGSILCFSCEVWFSSYNFIELNYTKIRITAHLKSWKKNKLISCWASPILLDVKILDDNTNNVVLASKVYDSTMLSPLCIKLVLRNVHKLCDFPKFGVKFFENSKICSKLVYLDRVYTKIYQFLYKILYSIFLSTVWVFWQSTITIVSFRNWGQHYINRIQQGAKNTHKNTAW